MFAGFRQITLHDAAQDALVPTLLFYPTAEPPQGVTLGPYLLDATQDAPVAAGRYPIVVISHGSGGTHVLYRSIAGHLARHGYAVALPEHPGNNRVDNSLYGTRDNLVNRPRHIRLVLDALSKDALLGPHLQQDRAAIIGHSMGGYTALAAAGGRPWSREGEPVDVENDARIRALVLLAPATAWFQPPDTLRQVTQPILILSGEHDEITPAWHAELVKRRVPDPSRIHWREVPGAGHFSFLSPFPSKLQAGGAAPTQDPAGFDRESFHRELPEEIRHFLDQHLKSQ